MRYELDSEDAITVGIFALAVLALVDIVSVQFMSYTFSDSLTTLLDGTVELTIAGGVAAAIWAFVYFTNDNNIELGSADDTYSYLVIVGTLVTLALIVSPDIQQWFIDQHDIISFLAPAASTGSLLAIGYYK